MNSRIENQTLYLMPEADLVASCIEKHRDYFVEQLKKNSDVTEIILDANGVETVDSLGVNLIIGLYRQAASETKVFEIIGAGKKFIKVADFFRFSSLFKIEAQGEL